MKKFLFIVFAASIIMIIAGCEEPIGTSVPSAPAAERNFDGSVVGEHGELYFSYSGVSLNMVYANNSSSITFPTGTNNSGNETLEKRFWISETELTNEVAADVLQWALDNKKIVETAGAHNELTSVLVKYGNQGLLYLGGNPGSLPCRVSYKPSSKEFTVEDKDYENHPVLYFTWYGAVMFCNWLTEMRDGNTDNVVYSGMDDDWEHNETNADNSKNGYRLPDDYEWEYAARYIDGTAWNDGDHVSGDTTAKYDESTVVDQYAWHFGNAEGDTHEVGQKKSNGLGLYDMSGNVWEWRFEIKGNNPLVYQRATSGGSISENVNSGFFQIGYSHSDPPASRSDHLGIRLCRTAD